MNANQFRHALDDIGITQVACARLLDINERTVRRYASGDAVVTVLVQWALMGLKAEAKAARATLRREARKALQESADV